jgi:DNA topoisomerase IA
VEVKHKKTATELVKNIEIRARGADVLMIWTDCDREGEHIGYEIAQVCRKVNARIRVKRARFSAIIHQCVHRSLLVQETIVDPSGIDKFITRLRTRWILIMHRQMQ